MSEFDPSEIFGDEEPEIKISLRTFDYKRNQLYGWLERNVKDNVGVFTINRIAVTRVVEVSEAFIESALEVERRIVDKKIAASIISHAWFGDEEDRSQKFSVLLGEDRFSPLEKEYIDEQVAEVIDKGAFNELAFARGLKMQYDTSITCDVSNVLNSMYIQQERSLHSMLPPLPLTDENSTHMGRSAEQLRTLSRNYADRVLGELFPVGRQDEQ